MNDYAHTYADHYDDTGREIEIKFLEHTDNCFIYYCDWKFDGLVDDTVISKRFGFIWWLVENDKIDFHIGSRWEKYLEYPIWSNNFDEVYDYKDIIQWLSISDTPIEELISYLK